MSLFRHELGPHLRVTVLYVTLWHWASQLRARDIVTLGPQIRARDIARAIIDVLSDRVCCRWATSTAHDRPPAFDYHVSPQLSLWVQPVQSSLKFAYYICEGRKYVKAAISVHSRDGYASKNGEDQFVGVGQSCMSILRPLDLSRCHIVRLQTKNLLCPFIHSSLQWGK